MATKIMSPGLAKAERIPSRPPVFIEPIWFEWLTLAGLLAFAGWLLGVEGVWALLLNSDPTGITLVIVVIFTGGTFWCGSRARELARQREALTAALNRGDQVTADDGWAAEYWVALKSKPLDAGAPVDLLLERSHGTHSTAWWVNGIQLKLGLLGKVIGFSILALQIGEIQSFDPSEAQTLLKSLTAGLGVALLTTMVGLVGNILLGLQLTRLDRFADEIVTRAQMHGMTIMAANAEQQTASVRAE